MTDLRVAVLAGGFSLEREASLLSGHNVEQVLLDGGSSAQIIEPDKGMLAKLGDFDVAFVAVHGRLGEDGTIQSMLDLAGIAYTGSSASPSALAWNKPVAKGILDRAGIPTPRFILFSTTAFRELGAADFIRSVGDFATFPMVVKPATGGSALGVSRAETPEDLPSALMHAMAYSEFVIVEEYIGGTEIAISILDGEPLPAVEIEPQVGLYDYSARYTAGATRYFVPARLSQDVLADAADVALRTWESLGARHLGRVDMIVDDDGTPWVLELATCPGLTSTSVFPLAAEATGGGFATAVDRIIDAAVRDARH